MGVRLINDTFMPIFDHKITWENRKFDYISKIRKQIIFDFEINRFNRAISISNYHYSSVQYIVTFSIRNLHSSYEVVTF